MLPREAAVDVHIIKHSDMKRRVTEANTDKAWAEKEQQKQWRERETALERDEGLKLVTQQEMDMTLKQSKLEKDLHHVSDPNLVCCKKSPTGGRDAKRWLWKIVQLTSRRYTNTIHWRRHCCFRE